MSKELEQFLAPGDQIPWESAAAFLVATKEATVEKVAVDEQSAREEVAKAKGKGLLSGIRSSVAQDVTHATRVKRTRGSRAGKELGALGGAATGFALGRKGGIAGKLGGTALGALIGRSAGKSIGEEIDRARTLKRYDRSKAKKAEIEKTSGLMRPDQPTAKEQIPGKGPKARAAREALRAKMRASCPMASGLDEEAKVAHVRNLWKLAQGEAPTEAMEGAEGATPAPGPVDVAGMSQEEMAAAGAVPAGPRVMPPSGAPSPEDLERAEAEEQLAQEMMADEAADQNAADYYKQMAEEANAQLEEAQQAIQEAQMTAEQASQQAQMSQAQADQATQQLQAQSQQDAAEKEQLNAQALDAKQNIMQMRQAMQAYRENLQQLALQDPTAMAGPSPEEQGMPPSDAVQAMGADEDAVEETEEAEKAEAEAKLQKAQAANAVDKEVMEQQAPQPPPAPGQPAAMGKQSSAIPELLMEKGATNRFLGAMAGAAGGAGIQALSDRKGPRGISEKERVLKSKLQSLQSKKNKTVFDKHMMTMTKAMHDTAKINRQHPGSAAAMAAITGAIAGATLAPTAVKMFGGK